MRFGVGMRPAVRDHLDASADTEAGTNEEAPGGSACAGIEALSNSADRVGDRASMERAHWAERSRTAGASWLSANYT